MSNDVAVELTEYRCNGRNCADGKAGNPRLLFKARLVEGKIAVVCPRCGKYNIIESKKEDRQ